MARCSSSPSTSTSSSTLREFYSSDYASCEEIRNTVYSRLVAQGHIQPRPNYRSVLRADTKAKRRSGKEFICTFADVTDGTSNSMLFFECAGRPFKFIEGRVSGDPDAPTKEPLSGAEWASSDAELWVDTLCGGGTQMMNCNNNNELYSFHPGGAMFLYCDGHVRFHPETIAPEAFVSRFTAMAGDVVSDL